jgi:hypothetical protein
VPDVEVSPYLIDGEPSAAPLISMVRAAKRPTAAETSAPWAVPSQCAAVGNDRSPARAPGAVVENHHLNTYTSALPDLARQRRRRRHSTPTPNLNQTKRQHRTNSTTCRRPQANDPHGTTDSRHTRPAPARQRGCGPRAPGSRSIPVRRSAPPGQPPLPQARRSASRDTEDQGMDDGSPTRPQRPTKHEDTPTRALDPGSGKTAGQTGPRPTDFEPATVGSEVRRSPAAPHLVSPARTLRRLREVSKIIPCMLRILLVRLLPALRGVSTPDGGHR